MSGLIMFLITALVTAISLIIISKIPGIGVEVDSMGKAIIAAIVFGLVNGILGPILRFLGTPITFLTLGLFALVINAIIFGISAWLVQGFRLRNGFISAFLGAIALSIINFLIFSLLGNLFPTLAPAA
jgi:putative membrane protein